jgi:predicted acylesterase/phospholipase RssA
VPIFLRRWMGPVNNWGFKKILTHLGIRTSLIDDFYLRLKLFRRFESHGETPTLKDLTFPVLMVAAPLQIIDSSPSQLWPGTKSRVSIVDALRASVAIPRLFAPTVVSGGELEHWVEGVPRPVRLDLVDGSVVRHNPLPALIRFLSGAAEFRGRRDSVAPHQPGASGLRYPDSAEASARRRHRGE